MKKTWCRNTWGIFKMTNASQPAPVFSDKPWLNEVLENDDEFYETEDVYVFSNDRRFKNSDRGGNGIYS